MATEGARKGDAERRLFQVAAELQREGFRLDGRDPAWRELCRAPDLASLSEGEMRERLIALAKVEGELEC